MCRVANHQTRLPRATSSLALNACRDGASTASLGNLFQCITSWVKKFLPISDLNLPCLSLKPFPLVLSLSTLVNSRCLSCQGVRDVLPSQGFCHILIAAGACRESVELCPEREAIACSVPEGWMGIGQGGMVLNWDKRDLV